MHNGDNCRNEQEQAGGRSHEASIWNSCSCTLTAKTISVLTVLAASGPKTVKELIAKAKAQPETGIKFD